MQGLHCTKRGSQGICKDCIAVQEADTRHKPTHPRRRTLRRWCGGVRAVVALLAVCAVNVLGCGSLLLFDSVLVYVRSPTRGTRFARSLRSKGGWYVCLRLRVGLASLAACARRVVGMCALDNAWGLLRSQSALEGWLVCVRLTWLEPKRISYYFKKD